MPSSLSVKPVAESQSLFSRGIVDLAHRPPGNVPSLDLLRSLAILLVFSGHFAGEFFPRPSVAHFPLFYFGWTGVDLFFVLSGFLIGCQLWKEVRRTGGIRVGRFLLRRGLRIWPLYYSFVIFVAARAIYRHHTGGLLADVFCVSNYFHSQVGGGWSLSSEEQFYIVTPLCILALLFAKVKPERLWLFPAAWLVLINIGRAYSLHHGMQPQDPRLYGNLHSHSDGLAVGLLFGWIFIFRPNLFLSRRFRVSVGIPMLLAAVALYIAERYVFRYSCLALIFGATLLLTYGPSVQKYLRWQGFYVMSRLSYGVYLNHFQIMPHLDSFLIPWRQRAGEPAFWLSYLFSLAICLAVAFLTFELIEWPFLALRSRWMSIKQQGDGYTAAPLSPSPAITR